MWKMAATLIQDLIMTKKERKKENSYIPNTWQLKGL